MKQGLIFPLGFVVAAAIIIGVVLGMNSGKETDEYTGLSECPSGFALYDMSLVDYSFCYAVGLGDPIERETSVDPSARIGTAYTVSFTESDELVYVETEDFALTGDRDAAPILKGGYECLTAAASDDAALEECFYDEVSDVDTYVDAQGTRQFMAWLKVQQIEGGTEDRSYLFIPDVKKDGKYNLLVSSSDFPEPLTTWGMQNLRF